MKLLNRFTLTLALLCSNVGYSAPKNAQDFVALFNSGVALDPSTLPDQGVLANGGGVVNSETPFDQTGMNTLVFYRPNATSPMTFVPYALSGNLALPLTPAQAIHALQSCTHIPVATLDSGLNALIDWDTYAGFRVAGLNEDGQMNFSSQGYTLLRKATLSDTQKSVIVVRTDISEGGFNWDNLNYNPVSQVGLYYGYSPDVKAIAQADVAKEATTCNDLFGSSKIIPVSEGPYSSGGDDGQITAAQQQCINECPINNSAECKQKCLDRSRP